MTYDPGSVLHLFGMVRLFGAVLALTFAGMVVVGRLAPSAPLTFRLSWGWIAGTGAATFAAFGLALFRLPIQIGLGVPLVVAAFFWRPLPCPRPAGRLNVARIALVLVFSCVLGLALTTISPGWDGLAIWGDKARRIAAEGTLPFDALQHPLGGPSHPEYPLHVPLRAAVLASVSGGWTETIMPLASTMDLMACFLLLLGVLEGLRADPTGRTLFFIAVLVVPMPFDEVCLGYADLTLAAAILGLLVATEGWFDRNRDRGMLAFAVICACTALWTKQEGLLLVVLAGAGALVMAPIVGRRRVHLFWAAGIVLLSALPWHILRLFAGFRLENFAFHEWGQLRRLPTILSVMATNLWDFNRWGLMWLIVFVILLLRIGQVALRRHDLRAGDLAGLFLVFAMSAIVFVFLSTPHEVGWHLATSLNRLLLQLQPAAGLFLISVIFKPEKAQLASACGATNKVGSGSDTIE
ncbi:MAG: hypothetical protein K8R59_07060 [Thermoanaerobaculales bacterium]|nr:hypothetical protein [Thermoanaerobaculales bacterium]